MRVPDKTPVLALKLTPEGRVDGVQPVKAVLESVGVGEPVAVTVKVPALPMGKAVELLLVKTGAAIGLAGTV